MWIETKEGQQVVGEISKDIVVQMAPDEAGMFDELEHDYNENPTPPRSTDDPLGFGAEALVALTPVIMAVVGAVLQFLLDKVLEAVKEESSAIIAQKIRLLFQRLNEPNQDALALTRAQFDELLRVIRVEASQRGMAPQEVDELANIISDRVRLAR